MTFALTNFKAHGVLIDTAGKKRGLQILELTITRGTDTALDVYDTAGTFWTAAKADATYGSLATKAAVKVGIIMGDLESLISCEITADNGFMFRVNGAPSAATEYRVQNAGTFPVVSPSITLNSNAAPATLKLVMVLSLKDEKRLQEFAY